MRLRLTGLIASLILIIGNSALGQPLREPTYEMKLEKAYSLMKETDYYNALDMFAELYRESRDEALLYPIAKLNYKMRDYERAARYFERALDKDEARSDLNAILMYARSQRVNGELNQALDLYQEFLGRNDIDSLDFLAQNDIVGMEASTKYERPKDLFATPLDKEVNSGLTEASPAMASDGKLYYSSFDKNGKITIDLKDDKAADFHFKIYSAEMDDEGEWDKAKKLKGKINREDYHTANVAFTPDGNTMYFTRNRFTGDSIIESVIFTSEWDGKDWAGAQELTGVNGDWIATHPMPGELFGKKVLFFASDMVGSYGGLDIFYAEHEGGVNYGIPVNLGSTINGPGNEITPFYLDGRLFFSSDGLPGMGGYDIFESVWNGSFWSSPKNMELVYNSEFDDLYLRYIDDGENGFLVSNRPYKGKRSPKNETCCDDIFAINTQEVELDIMALVFNEYEEPIEGATLEILELKRKEKVLRDAQTNPNANNFNLPLQEEKAYLIRVKAPGYFPDSIEINTVGYAISHTFDEAFFLKSREPETIEVTINEPIRLNNIYYDFDDDKILKDAEQDLDLLYNLMNEYPDMVIELSSHTDSRGNDGYNQDLSQRRANSAKEYLVGKGIDQRRVQAVGYGEIQIMNKCTNGVDCTEEEHRINRRTEFKIIAGPTTIQIKKEVLRDRARDDDDKGSGFIAPPDQFYKSMASLDNYQEPLEEKKAKLKWTETFHDFGVVKEGTKPKCEFEFLNESETPLLIEWVNTSKCATVEWPKEAVAPGMKAKIKVTYDSSNREGEHEVAISVIANTEPTVSQARFRAFVEKPQTKF